MAELELDCTACNENQKVERGCKEDSPIPGKWQVGGCALQRCPKTVITAETGEWLRAFRRFKNGMLPNSGGWLEQSAVFNDVIDVIEVEICEMENEKMREEKKSITRKQ